MKDLTGLALATKIVQFVVIFFAILMMVPSTFFTFTRHDPFELLNARMMNNVGILALLLSSALTVVIRRIQALEEKLDGGVTSDRPCAAK